MVFKKAIGPYPNFCCRKLIAQAIFVQETNTSWFQTLIIYDLNVEYSMVWKDGGHKLALEQILPAEVECVSW